MSIYHLSDLKFLFNYKSLNVGILGGSFNPAHHGHLLISKQAIDELKLDYVIWLVAKQNPFKPQYKEDIITRSVKASLLVQDKRILVSPIESELTNSGYTYDILKAFKVKFSQMPIFWLMGADNALNFEKWYRYQDIIGLCHRMIVFTRPGYVRKFYYSKLAKEFTVKSIKAPCSISTIEQNLLDGNNCVKIIFYKGKTSNLSSSSLRNKKYT